MILTALLILLAAAAAAMVWSFCYTFVRNRREERFYADLDYKYNLSLHPYRDTVERGLRFIAEQPHEELSVTSFDGLRLAASYYPCEGAKTTILLFHGYRSVARRDFSCAVEMYHGMGMNVLLVDERSHGRSEGTLISFGVKERRDVLSWISCILARDPGARLILGGMSMGAATVMFSAALGLPENVKGIIADCGFTSADEIILTEAKRLLPFGAPAAERMLDLMCRLFGHFSLSDASATEALRSSGIPVLLIHGDADTYVPVEMSYRTYEAATGKKSLCIVHGANHGFSFLVDKPKVLAAVESFLAGI